MSSRDSKRERHTTRQDEKQMMISSSSIIIHPYHTLNTILFNITNDEHHDIKQVMSILTTIQSWYTNKGLKMEDGAYPALALDTTPLSSTYTWFNSYRYLYHFSRLTSLPHSTLSSTSVYTLIHHIRTLTIYNNNNISHTSISLLHLIHIHLILATSHLLLAILYKHLTRIQYHIRYWTTHTYHHSIYTYLRGTHDITAKEKLKQLKIYNKKWMIRAGRLHSWIHSLSSTHATITSISPSPTYTILCERLYRYICGEKSTRIQTIDDINICMEECIQGLTGLDEHLTDTTIPYEIPSHFARYWGIYTITCATTLITSYQLYTHRDELQTWISQASISTYAFIDEHVIIPLRNIIRHVFHTFYETSTTTSTTTTTRDPVADALSQYKQSQQNLTDMLLTYGKHHQHDITSDTLYERAINGDMSIVMDTYTRQVEKPIKSVMFGDLTTGILIQVQKLKVDGEAALLNLEQLLQQNAINFNLLAIIPAGLFIWGGIHVTSRIGRMVFRERDTTTLYRMVRTQIHHIIMLLIRAEQMDTHDTTTTTTIATSPTPVTSARDRRSKRISPQHDPLDLLTPLLVTPSDPTDDILVHGDLHLHIYRLYRLIWQLYGETCSRWTRVGDDNLLRVMRTLVWMMNQEMTYEQQRICIEQIYHIHPQLAQR